MYKQLKKMNKPLWFCLKNSENCKRTLLEEYKKTIKQFDAYWCNVIDVAVTKSPDVFQYKKEAEEVISREELIDKKYRQETEPLRKQITALRAQIQEKTEIRVNEKVELQKEVVILQKKRDKLIDRLTLDFEADKKKDYYDFICAIILKKNLPCKKHISAEDQERIMNNNHKQV